MKKIGIRLLLSLILVTAVVVVAATPVIAAKPVKLIIRIQCIEEGSITVQYWWDKIGAHYYQIFVYKIGVGPSLNYTGLVDLGGRTPHKSGYVTLTSTDITCGPTYYRVSIRLYRNHMKPIHGALVYSPLVSFDCPPPSIFAEDFCGVPEGSLPEGWVTNNSSLVYVWNFDQAGGQGPELYMDYGWPDDETQDYYVRTPVIDATATTTALNLTFKHYLDIFGWDKSFTYSVEVLDLDVGGSEWEAVLEETPTPAGGDEIGPETKFIDLIDYLGKNILIRWRLRGYTYYSDGWRIDDVIVNGS